MKSYHGKINTNFQGNKTPKEGSHFICLSMILIDSVFRTGTNYYPRVILEEYENIATDKKIHSYIIDDVEISSDEESSNEENSAEKILEKIQIKKNSDEEDSSEEYSRKKDCNEENEIFSTHTNITKSYVNIEEIII